MIAVLTDSRIAFLTGDSRRARGLTLVMCSGGRGGRWACAIGGERILGGTSHREAAHRNSRSSGMSSKSFMSASSLISSLAKFLAFPGQGSEGVLHVYLEIALDLLHLLKGLVDVIGEPVQPPFEVFDVGVQVLEGVARGGVRRGALRLDVIVEVLRVLVDVGPQRVHRLLELVQLLLLDVLVELRVDRGRRLVQVRRKLALDLPGAVLQLLPHTRHLTGEVVFTLDADTIELLTFGMRLVDALMRQVDALPDVISLVLDLHYLREDGRDVCHRVLAELLGQAACRRRRRARGEELWPVGLRW